MKRKLFWTIAVCTLSLLTFSACAPAAGPAPAAGAANTSESQEPRSSGAAEYHKISPEEAKEKIDANPAVTIVDVRSQEEYDAGHIENAILIPLDTIGDERPAQLSDPDAEILVYCRTGVRSKNASEKLVALGYTNIYDIGGIMDWPYGAVTGE